ncbi:MAG: hypothetical protein ABSG64_02650 [Solirubrobacteraceae bacterium]
MRLPSLPAVSVALLAAAALGALAAPAAQAGQIVWTRAGGVGIWAMNDDGTYQRALVATTFPTLASLTGGWPTAVGEPDVFQAGGTTVAFTDMFVGGICGIPCGGPYSGDYVYTLSNGTVTAESPAPAADASVFENQPRMAGNDSVAFGLYGFASSGSPSGPVTSLGTPATAGIYTQPVPLTTAATVGTPWADTLSETLETDVDVAPDPINPSVFAWVEDQDRSCTLFAVAGSPMCQYAVVVGTTSTVPAPVSIYDDESPGGTGPTSLAWSSNGADLLIVDDRPPNDGIYEFPATTAVAPASKTVTEVIAEPPGWTFGQARFAGSRIVFDAAGEGSAMPGTSDIYSISAKCDAGTCAFPANASNLTHDPSADNIDPAWTSAAPPLVAAGDPLTASTPPAIDAASLVKKTVTPATGVSIEVTLNEAGTLRAAFSHNSSSLGAVSVKAPAGAFVFHVKRLHGRSLAPAHDTATLSVVGGSGSAAELHLPFTVVRARRRSG